MNRDQAKEFVGNTITEVREWIFLSQAALARKLNTSRQRVFQWENKEHLPKAREIKALEEALGLKKGYLWNKVKSVYDKVANSTDSEVLRVGHLLRNCRFRLGLSQTDLARQVGTFTSKVSNWETGRSSPSEAYLKKLAEALDIEKHLLELRYPSKVVTNL